MSVFPLKLQTIEWNEFDINNSVDENENKFDYSKLEYTIYAYGRTLNNKSVTIEIKGYRPELYIKFDNNKLKTLNLIKSKCKYFKIKSEYKKEFYGFTNNEMQEYCKIEFDNLSQYYETQKILKNSKIQLYESNFDTFLKFLHSKDLQPTGWVNVLDGELNDSLSNADINITCNVDEIEKYDTEESAPFLQASFDIETFSSTGAFPSPEVEKDYIIQVATTFKHFTENTFKLKHIITMKQCNEINDVEVKCVETEQELILEWAKLINRTDPDIIYHYNGDWFDWWYLYERAKRYGKKFVKTFLVLINRLKPHTLQSECQICCKKIPKSSENKEQYSGCNLLGYYNTSSFSSSAYGTSKYRKIVMLGRVNFDILIYIQREYKEKKYTLDFISNKYLNENKVDLPYQKMFDLFDKGLPEDITKIAEYCVKDSELPQKLVDKLAIFQTQISMSNVTYVPIRYLIERGQQIKAFSQILKLTKKKNYIVPAIYKIKEVDEETEEDSFEGATVLEPEVGSYFQPVTVCDFASLYPSIIRCHNLCYSTYVNDPKYLKLEGVEFTEIKCNDNTHYFAKNTESVLPELLSELAKSRKLYKNKMNETKDPFIKELYNKTQLAYKVSMNSVYGFLAAQKLTCKPIAESVTSIGRTMIDKTKSYIEENYKKSRVIYGDTDSVFVIFYTKSLNDYLKVNEYMTTYKVDDPVKNEQFKQLQIKCRKEAMEMGIDASNNITNKVFNKPISLEFEKVYDPLVLVSKKRYFGGYYASSVEKYDYKQCKGLLPNRRDNFVLATEAFNKGIDLIVDKGKRGISEFVVYLKELINNIRNNNIDNINNFVIIKKLNDTYKTGTLDNQKSVFKIIGINEKKDKITIKVPSNVNISELNDNFKITLKEFNTTYLTEKAIMDEDDNIFVKLKEPIKEDIVLPKTTRSRGHTTIKFTDTVLKPNQPHVVLARKLTKRNPENPPKTNDRISYLFIDTNSTKKEPQYKKVEDPEYAIKHNLKIDSAYYIKAIENPIGQVLDLFDSSLRNEIFR